MGSSSSKSRQEEKQQQNILINNGIINVYVQNNIQYQSNQAINFQSQINRPSSCCCPLCGEEFLKGKFINSGESKSYFICRKCYSHQNNKYYFKCNNCESKFCTDCPKKNNYIPNYSCPLCGEQFSRGHGRFLNSGESKSYFICRKCESHLENKYYFKCETCESKFCTKCPENTIFIRAIVIPFGVGSLEKFKRLALWRF